jgi:hypothetical protein
MSRKTRRILDSPVLLKLEVVRKNYHSYAMGIVIFAFLALSVSVALRDAFVSQSPATTLLGKLGVILLLLPIFTLAIVALIPTPLVLTERGISKWPLVSLYWEETEGYDILSVSINRPVWTLNLISNSPWYLYLPIPLYMRGIRFGDEERQSLKEIFAEKRIPEYM